MQRKQKAESGLQTKYRTKWLYLDIGEFCSLVRLSLDWARAMLGEADREMKCATFTYHSSGQIYETSAKSMDQNSPATRLPIKILGPLFITQLLMLPTWDLFHAPKS